MQLPAGPNNYRHYVTAAAAPRPNPLSIGYQRIPGTGNSIATRNNKNPYRTETAAHYRTIK